jgi:glycosyltransferase involved in cell wall biosynthesis
LFSKLEERDSLKIYNYPNYGIFRKKRDCKSIGIFHGVEWDTGFFEYVYREYKYRQNGFRGLLKAVIKYVYFASIVLYFVQRGIENLNKVVSVDSNILYYLTKRLSDKIVVIPNYVDCNLFYPISQDTEEKVNKIYNFLVPRNLNVARGVFLIPDVCLYLLKFRKDFIFNIVGTGPLKEYLEKKIIENNLQQFIKLIGHIPHTKMPELYRKADIVLIPSIFSEGTTLAALEAMACSKLLITTNVGGLREIGEDMISKVVVKPNAKDIAEKILFILEHKEVSNKIANTARDYVCNNFSKELWEKQWKKLIQETIQQSN